MLSLCLCVYVSVCLCVESENRLPQRLQTSDLSFRWAIAFGRPPDSQSFMAAKLAAAAWQAVCDR